MHLYVAGLFFCNIAIQRSVLVESFKKEMCGCEGVRVKRFRAEILSEYPMFEEIIREG